MKVCEEPLQEAEEMKKTIHSLRGQIGRFRLYLLAAMIIFTLDNIHFSNLYSKVQAYYLSIIDLDRRLHEQYLEILRVNQEISGSVQTILDIFEFQKPDFEEIPSSH